MALFIAALVCCALVPLNAWPFSSWELFSHLRTDRQAGWGAAAVDAGGRERPYPTGLLPHGYHGFPPFIAAFSKRPAAERDAVCIGWLRDAERTLGPDTRLIRIYRLKWLLSDRSGDRAAPPHRRLVWTCSAKGARAPD